MRSPIHTSPASQEAKSRSTKIASQLLQDRLVELKAQAADAERALQNYKANHNLEGADKDRPEQNSEHERRIDEGDASRWPRPRIVWIESGGRPTEGPRLATVADTSNDSIVTKLRTQYMDLAQRADEISLRVPPGHEALVKLQRRMAELRTSIRTE